MTVFKVLCGIPINVCQFCHSCLEKLGKAFGRRAIRSTFGLTDLAYADDIALLGDSFAAVQEAVNRFHRFAAVAFYLFFFTSSA